MKVQVVLVEALTSLFLYVVGIEATCTFEASNICGYRQDYTDNFNWIRRRGATPSSGTGPSADHTLGSVAGFYMFIETSSPSRPNWRARLLGPIERPTFGKCLEFWYHMHGSTVGRLNVYRKISSGFFSKIWTESGNHGNQWLVSQVTVLSWLWSYQIVFEGVKGQSFTGDIAIDDVRLRAGQCPNPGNCDFENGLCTYRNDKQEDDFNWLQRKGSTPSQSTGPSVDHTRGTASGTYMFIETSSPRRPGEKARLLSQYFDTTPSLGRCVQFWYHMYGSHIGSLNIIWKTGLGNQSETLLWTLSGNQQNKWLYARVPLPRITNRRHNVVFEAICGTSFAGDIAIDDIQFTAGICGILPASADPNKPYNCDFENGFCQYSQDVRDVFDWARIQGDTQTAETGPLYDHTIQQGVTPNANGPGSLQHKLSGKCIHVLNGAHTKPATGTELVYYDGCGQFRLEFSFTSGRLWKHNRFGMCVSRRGGSGSKADDVVVTDSCSEQWQMTAKGSIKHITTGKCIMSFRGYTNPPNNVKIVLSTTCDDSSNKQSMHWSPSLGYYAYIEASSPRQPNDTARLFTIQSISSSPSPGKCLSFWFHMYGPNIGSLNVYLKSGNNLGNPVWSRLGTHGNRWNNALVPLNRTTPFSIVFEGVRGSGDKGDISLDDIQVMNGPCPSIVSCDFETQTPQYCGWTNSRSDKFDWTYQQGATSSISTGPKFDHTFGDGRGHYMYIEVSGSIATGAKAWLESPLFSPDSGKCLEFWYHMYGSTVGQLNVYLKTGASLPSSPAWSRSRDQGNQWFIAQVTMKNISSNLKVVFEGIRGSSSTGDIAIDDIHLRKNACNKPAYCDFELYDWCTWTNDRKEDDFDWIVGSGTTPSDFTGPSNDHTTGFGYGKYSFIEVSSPRKPGDKARLLSERFSPTSSRGNCVKFWFHMYGSSIGTLNVVIKKRPGNKSEDMVWSLSGNQGNTWIYGQAPIRSSDSFQITFEGVIIRGTGSTGDIALDDIEFVAGTCPVTPIAARPTAPLTTVVPSAPATTVGPTTGPTQSTSRTTNSTSQVPTTPAGISTPVKTPTTTGPKQSTSRTTNSSSPQVPTTPAGISTPVKTPTTTEPKQSTSRTANNTSQVPTTPAGISTPVKTPTTTGPKQSTSRTTNSSSPQVPTTPAGISTPVKTPTTTAPTTQQPSTTPPHPSECSSYQTLSTRDRAQGVPRGNILKCDKNNITTKGWYRFRGASGSAMPTSCVPVNRCGTHAPGWMQGSHPTVVQGVVSRKVCYHWTNNCCKWSNIIRVRNCGGFYVYELNRTPVCNLRYCGNAEALRCSPFRPLNNGIIAPGECSNGLPVLDGTRCVITCNTTNGYKSVGVTEATCRNGIWTDNVNATTCRDVSPPDLSCPQDITISTDRGKAFATLRWDVPQPSDNSEQTPSLGITPIGVAPPHQFSVGTTRVSYTARDAGGLTSRCTFQVKVQDNEAPQKVRCPPDTNIETRGQYAVVILPQAKFTDNVGVASITTDLRNGTLVTWGTHIVKYTATDRAGNMAVCKVKMIVISTVCNKPVSPRHGVVPCEPIQAGLRCIVRCNEGYDFALTTSQVYTCSPQGMWTIGPNKFSRTLSFPDCTAVQNAKATIRCSVQYSVVECPTDTTSTKEAFQRMLLPHLLKSFIQANFRSIETTCKGNRKRRRSTSNQKLGISFQVEVPFPRNTPRMNRNNAIVNITTSIKKVIDGSISRLEVDGKVMEHDKSTPIAVNFESLNCDTGKVLKGSVCVNCPSGYFLSSTSKSCKACPADQYQDQESQTSCVPCPGEGSTNKITGAKQRSKCITKSPRKEGLTSNPGVLSSIIIIPILLIITVVIVFYYKWKSSRDNAIKRQEQKHLTLRSRPLPVAPNELRELSENHSSPPAPPSDVELKCEELYVAILPAIQDYETPIQSKTLEDATETYTNLYFRPSQRTSQPCDDVAIEEKHQITAINTASYENAVTIFSSSEDYETPIDNEASSLPSQFKKQEDPIQTYSHLCFQTRQRTSPSCDDVPMEKKHSITATNTAFYENASYENPVASQTTSQSSDDIPMEKKHSITATNTASYRNASYENPVASQTTSQSSDDIPTEKKHPITATNTASYANASYENPVASQTTSQSSDDIPMEKTQPITATNTASYENPVASQTTSQSSDDIPMEKKHPITATNTASYENTSYENPVASQTTSQSSDDIPMEKKQPITATNTAYANASYEKPVSSQRTSKSCDGIPMETKQPITATSTASYENDPVPRQRTSRSCDDIHMEMKHPITATNTSSYENSVAIVNSDESEV